MVKKTFSEWLSLSEAAAVLGVHPGTVRKWSNEGILPVHRTHGGHRRFRRNEVVLWKESQSAEGPAELDKVIQSALRNTRFHISEGHLSGEVWYCKLDDLAREQYRQSGRMMMHGLFGYLSYNEAGENLRNKTARAEAHAVGYDYGIRAHRYGLSVIEAAQAFTFFRNVLIDAMLSVYEESSIRSPFAWSAMFRKINAFTDEIMTSLLETYEAFQKNGKEIINHEA